MEQKKEYSVLAILGGPHKNGTTAKMLDIAVKECEAKGQKVQRIDLYDMNIKFCIGCRACIKKEECIMKDDDMVEITKLIKNADKIILATPTYWANVPATVKNLFDRLNGVAMEETKAFPKPRLKGKKYIILTACNTPAPFSYLAGQTRGSIRAMNEFFKTAGMKKAGIIACTNTGKKKDVPDSKRRKIEKIAVR